MACVSAIGQHIPSFVLMKGQQYNDNFETVMLPGTKLVFSQRDYMK
jgi:hypothetical protein